MSLNLIGYDSLTVAMKILMYVFVTQTKLFDDHNCSSDS